MLPTIVYIDDSPDDRRVFRTQIAAHIDNPVFYLSAAEDLLQRLDPASPEYIRDPGMILVDLVLPGMSGYHLVKKLRDEYKHLDLTPLIVVAGSFDEASIATATAAGADYYIGKPITLFSLTAALKELNEKLGQFGLAIVRRDRGASPSKTIEVTVDCE
jgi:CheY-like chemotaxis protein